MAESCVLADRTWIRAFRAGDYVLIVAEGELPTPAFDVDIVTNPRKIFPPQFDLLRCPIPGIVPQVITPYLYAESVRFPAGQPVVTVHHADGTDSVDIEPCGEELSAYAQAVSGPSARPCPEGAEEATGLSRNLSFDEAFANALANLPPFEPPFPDALARVEVVEIGGLFGGIAGFNHLFVRICRTVT